MKLVYVVRGEILDVAVDIRYGSPNFGYWHSTILNEQNHKQLIIPADFAHGFCVLSEYADLIYLLSDEYDADDQHRIRWSDPEIGINWPIDNQFSRKKIKFALSYQKYRESICLYTKYQELFNVI